MGIYFDSIITDFLTLIILLITTIFLYSKYVYNYWTRQNISQIEPTFPFGNVKQLMLRSESISVVFAKMYNEFKSRNVPFGGYYMLLSPELLITDPGVIKQVLVKDFDHFVDRGSFMDEEVDPLSTHLFNLEGQKWKNLRAKLTPTFTSGKMKMMFHTLTSCASGLENLVDKMYKNQEPLDIKEILARFTTDVIGNCAFGIDCNCLQDENTEFRKFGQKTLEPEGFDKYRVAFSFFLPNIFKYFKIPALNKDASDFFMNIVKDTVRYREENKVIRKDFMQLLLQLKNQGQVLSEIDSETAFIKGGNSGLTIEELASQCFIFFLAGFETSSTTMAFCLYELAKNPLIQEKLREEICTVLKKHDNNLTYEAIMEMSYMEKVINETLRKYPPLGFLNRQCTKDYKLPKSNHIIRKGDIIRISVLGLQNDPEYYPDPDKFDPERFSETEKAKRDNLTFIPFGEGPRVCIGLRFGMMQTKVGLTSLLKNFKFTVDKKTGDKIEMDPNNFILSAKGKIWLNAKKV